jgi:hypothetical protein
MCRENPGSAYLQLLVSGRVIDVVQVVCWLYVKFGKETRLLMDK